jgi:hypothetical protein
MRIFFMAGARAASQCMTVTANTTMIAALSEPMMARGTSSLRYVITAPRFERLIEDVRERFSSTAQKK